jgi:hypothetical protein
MDERASSPPEEPKPRRRVEVSGRARRARLTKRRWGYIVWGVGLSFVFIPELLASVQSIERHLPFTTISAMVGHLEFENALWELAPTVLIVFALYSLVRIPPHRSSGGHTPESIRARAERGELQPHRTAAGRLTFKPAPTSKEEFDDQPLEGWAFALRTLLGCSDHRRADPLGGAALANAERPTPRFQLPRWLRPLRKHRLLLGPAA